MEEKETNYNIIMRREIGAWEGNLEELKRMN
jgi:hypothetical protein